MAAVNPISTETTLTPSPYKSRVLVIGKGAQLSWSLQEALDARNCLFRQAAGSADSLRQLRKRPYDVVVTDPHTSVVEDLALLSELRAIRPGVRVILLTQDSTPEDIIAALRARVFLIKSPPFDADEIADYALRAGTETDVLAGIEVLSAQRDWVSLRINSERFTAERLVEFLTELQTGIKDEPREQL